MLWLRMGPLAEFHSGMHDRHMSHPQLQRHRGSNAWPHGILHPPLIAPSSKATSALVVGSGWSTLTSWNQLTTMVFCGRTATTRIAWFGPCRCWAIDQLDRYGGKVLLKGLQNASSFNWCQPFWSSLGNEDVAMQQGVSLRKSRLAQTVTTWWHRTPLEFKTSWEHALINYQVHLLDEMIGLINAYSSFFHCTLRVVY